MMNIKSTKLTFNELSKQLFLHHIY